MLLSPNYMSQNKRDYIMPTAPSGKRTDWFDGKRRKYNVDDFHPRYKDIL